MKNIIFSIITLVTVAAVTISCNQSSNKNSDQQANDSTTIAATPELQSPTHKDTVPTVSSTYTSSQEAEKSDVKQAQKFTIAPIIKDYLALKNALVADNDKAAANAGKQLFTTLKNVDMNAIPANKHKE